MIKFFRKIRRNLLQKNRIGKYLLYAFGEIILVVIGILIALQLNNINEEKANEEKIISILKEVQKDLKTDIVRAKQHFDRYIKEDSIQNLIFNNKYTYKDYKDDKAPLIGSLYNAFVPLRNGFDNLNNNLNLVPTKYDSIVNELKILYTIDFSYIYRYNERIQKTVYEHIDVIFAKDWALDFNRNIRSEKLINFFYSDPYYKSYLIKYLNDRVNLTSETQYLRFKAKELYKKISKLTGNTENLFDAINYNNPDTTVVNLMIGTYQLKEFIGNGWHKKIKIAHKDQNLTMTLTNNENDNFETTLTHQNNTVFSMNPGAMYIRVEKNKITIFDSTSGNATYTKSED